MYQTISVYMNSISISTCNNMQFSVYGGRKPEGEKLIDIESIWHLHLFETGDMRVTMKMRFALINPF